MKGKERLDQLLVERGLADSRNQAQALIRAGEVEVDGQRRDKPGMPVARSAEIRLRAKMPYVGRGGFKLAGALDAWPIDPRGRICLDVGASTGGFTDLLLQRGASRVYAVDVGRGQLAWKLRGDERVVNMERQDVRGLESLPEAPSLCAVDVSFIGLRAVLPGLRPLLAPGAELVLLVKPQFEAGRDKVGRGGIVRDPEVQREAIARVLDAAAALGWAPRGAMPSPLRGTQGNQEFLLWLVNAGADDGDEDGDGDGDGTYLAGATLGREAALEAAFTGLES